MKNYSVIFDSNDISQVPGVSLYNYNATDLPTRDIKIFKIARRSLSVVTSSEYTQKNITVFMKVCSGTRQDTEETITDLKGIISAQNGTLEVTQSNDQYLYTATMNEFNIEWQGSTAWCVIVFVASTPIATAKEQRTLGTFTTTASTGGTSFIVDGSYYSEPYITVQFTSVTGGTGGSVSLFNATTNQGITVSHDFVSGDVLEVDCKNYRVMINGGSRDFTGLFPVFAPGSQRLGYTDTFSARNITATVEYRPEIV